MAKAQEVWYSLRAPQFRSGKKKRSGTLAVFPVAPPRAPTPSREENSVRHCHTTITVRHRLYAQRMARLPQAQAHPLEPSAVQLPS